MQGYSDLFPFFLIRPSFGRSIFLGGGEKESKERKEEIWKRLTEMWGSRLCFATGDGRKWHHSVNTVHSRMPLQSGWSGIQWMSHRKQKDTKQQPGTAGPGNIFGCCLVSLRFLCDIHCIHYIQEIHFTNILVPIPYQQKLTFQPSTLHP